MTAPSRLDIATGEGKPNWEDYCYALEGFARREGHCRPPYRGAVDGLKLYDGAARQRAHSHRLTLPQRRRLSRIPGWAWNVREDH
jgi:hypothetical protein